MANPREQLKGLELKDGWKVLDPLSKSPSDTGGHFSTGYTVQSPEGKKYFLKAIDFSAALNDPDPARRIQQITESFNLERDLLAISQKMSCVIKAVKDGTIAVGDPASPQVVQYLIMELADGDLRRMATVSGRLPMSLTIRVLHNIANGLRQLHREQIAHQDLKPSNVLAFDDGQFKVGDLGRASIKGRNAPHDVVPFAGDMLYAPPELLYGYTHQDFMVRRIGADAYLLGSLATFLLTGASMTSLIVSELDPNAHHRAWGGTYDQVLPQVHQAFARSMNRVGKEIPNDAPYREELLQCIKELCEPDVNRRGHPRTRAMNANGGNIYELDRYVSIFDRLSFEVQLFEKRKSI